MVPAVEMHRPDPSARRVVIDVLRATTCIAAALQAGASCVIPCLTPEEARERRTPGALLAGERGSLPLEGFDLGNSPLEFTPERVRGRTILMTTTNGTRALRAAPGPALCAGLVNRAAVARSLLGCAAVDVVCAGTDGRFSADDWGAAGALLAGLREVAEVEADDGARAAEAWFLAGAADLEGLLAATAHGRRLAGLGLQADLAACARLDVWDVVPVFRDGVIR